MSPNTRQENQRPTPSKTQEFHKTTKLKSIKYTRRAWCRAGVGLCLFYRSQWAQMSFSELVWRALFYWCPPSHLSLAFVLPPLSSYFPELWGQAFEEDTTFRAVCLKDSLTAYYLALDLSVLFPIGRISHNSWIRNWSMSTVDFFLHQ